MKNCFPTAGKIMWEYDNKNTIIMITIYKHFICVISFSAEHFGKLITVLFQRGGNRFISLK